jgi:nucleotide sugar dehydrogenase
MKIAVIGAGKMGLPVASQFAWRGGEVIACDINEQLVASINAGKMPFDEPGVGEILAQAVASGSLRATTDVAGTIPLVDVVIIIIPVMLNSERKADMAAIESVTRTIAAHMIPGQMFCFEATLPVGSTRRCLQPILESSGYRAGVDFDLVFSPERVKSQLVLKHLAQVPKIVGGVNAASARRAETFYQIYLGAPVIKVDSLETAEFSKLAGMVYRDANIALANELAVYAEAVGLDFSSVSSAANTDGESALLAPSIGVGGHCTPIYPYFVLQDAHDRGVPLPITANSRIINDSQARRLLDRVSHDGGEFEDQELLILGLAFRPRVKEHTLSSAFLIRDEATRRGATTFLHDPLYDPSEIRSRGFTPIHLDGELPAIVVLNTGHPEYREIDFEQWRNRGVRIVVDGRNFWHPSEIQDAGLHYIAPGYATPQSKTANFAFPKKETATSSPLLCIEDMAFARVASS